MKHFWKRLVACALTVVMLLGMMPPAAYAALWENSSSRNREILAALVELCGSEDEARYYYDLLEQYGLLDEDGDLFTNWSGVITIREDSTPLTIAEVRAMTGGSVTVNGRACSAASLNAALDRMEALGLLVDNTPVADWQLQVDGQGVAPGSLRAALEAWQAPEAPAEPEETPAGPEVPEEGPAGETPEEAPEEAPAENGPGEEPEESGAEPVQMSARSVQNQAAPVVTALGQSVDSGEVLEVIAFLDQYGLLTETGCAVDWNLVLPGGDREIMVEELLDMVERGELADSAVVDVDGIPVTVADLKVMLEIEEYIAYLRRTYFDGHQWTQEQLDNLEDLVNQINNEGIEFLLPGNMDELSQLPDDVWPSGIRHDVIATVDVPEISFTDWYRGYCTFTIRLNKAQLQPVTFDYKITRGSISVSPADESTDGSKSTSMAGQITIPVGETEAKIEVKFAVAVGLEGCDGDLFFTFSLSNLKNAVFEDGGTNFYRRLSAYYSESRSMGHEPWFFAIDPSGHSYYVYWGDDPNRQPSYVYAPPGEYTVGQVIPITIRAYYEYLFPIKGTPEKYNQNGPPTITCWTDGNTEPQTLTALEATTDREYSIGSVFSFEYKVRPGDSGPLRIGDSVSPLPVLSYPFGGSQPQGNPEYERFRRAVYFIPPKYDGTIAEDGVLYVETPISANNKANVAKATVASEPPRRNAFADFSIQLNEGREGLKNPQMTVSVTLSDNPVYTEWLLSAAIQNTEGEGFVTDPEQLGFSFDGGETRYSFPIPTKPGGGDPIEDFTGVTLTATIDLPLRNDIPKKWSSDPGYPATEDKLWVAELYVGDEPAYGFADADTQRGIRFSTWNWGDSSRGDFAASMELVHKDTGKPWTEEDYRNIGYTQAGIAFDSYPARYMPWFTPEIPAMSVRDAELKLNIERVSEDDGPPLSFGDTSRVTGFQLDGEGGYQWDSSRDTFCRNFPLDPTADFGLMAGGEGYASSAVRVNPDGSITYLTPGFVSFEAHILNGMMEGTRAIGEICNQSVSMDFLEYIPLPEFPAPTQEEWAQTWRAMLGSPDVSVPETPKSWADFAKAMSQWAGSEKPLQSWGDLCSIMGWGKLFHISMGSEPFLELPNPEMQATGGQDVTVYWSSNLCELNKGDTVFIVTVTKGGDTVYTTTAVGSRDNPASSVTIPADRLKYDYGADASNRYTVTVSTTYQNMEYTAAGTIDLAAKPAKVKLDTLSSYYITDATSSVTIGWDLTDFGDTSQGQGANQQFELLITRGSTEAAKVTSPGEAYGDGNANYRGSTTLNITDVVSNSSDPTSFRDVYTVTVKAMAGNNGTWSYDSFLLYVYDQNALDILIGGKSVGSYTLSNRDRISGMDQDQIVALNRDIQLKEVVSTNYGERAWNALADQIIWKSSDSGVASINYPQGSYYDNIENYSYVSYRPTTDFGILGRENGQTTFTATHKVTGIKDSVPVTVETLENRLYLFQFYPQAETTIVYTNGNGQEKRTTSDANGAAAIYEESGITGNIYCSSTDNGKGYRGTIYPETLKSGEGDWTKLEQYPCNNLNLRRTAYAYLYLKNPDGTPYTGTVSFRGGIYINGKYVDEGSTGLFFLNGTNTPAYGNQGVTVNLSGTNGKLTVEMDQMLWNSRIRYGDQVSYIFELISTKGSSEDTSYYPIFATINASANQNAFVSSGEAIVNFRENPAKDDAKHPFIATQIATLGSGVGNVMDYTGYVGINEDIESGTLSTVVMWWNDEGSPAHSLQLVTSENRKIAGNDGEYTIETTTYPFTSHPVTNYTVRLDKDTVGRLLGTGKATGVTLRYYTDDKMVRYEEMPYRLGNLRGAGKAEDSAALLNEIKNMGNSFGTDASKAKTFAEDKYVSLALEFVADKNYTEDDDKAFQMQIAPTSDPTKFLGLISVSMGSMNDSDQVTGIYGEAVTGKADLDAAPGFREIMALAGEKTPLAYGGEVLGEFLDAKNNRGINSVEWGVSGYMEALIYYDFDAYAWQAQILSGGFNAGGGMSRSWRVNTWAGIIPFTATLSVGGSAQVSMDALAVSYYNQTKDLYGMGNDFLTELRLYLYLKFFAGIGFDYSVVAAKVGVFGQIDLDMAFQWLNRPYMDSDDKIMNVADKSTNEGTYNLNGQNFKIRGTVGLEALFKLLFISYEKILCSKTFNILDAKTGQWEKIQTNWDLNSEANSAAIDGMMKNGSLDAYSAGGQQMVSLNLAPTLEDRSYLENGGRVWGQGFSLFSLDDNNGLKNLESNTYPYANPVVTDDGQLVVYLHDNSSVNVEETVVKYATKSGTSYRQGSAIPAPDDNSEKGYGDSQLSLAGTGSMAVAAWTRQMTSIQKDPIMTDPETGKPVYGQDPSGNWIYSPVLTADEQMMMLNGTEIYASVYANGSWTTTRMTENSTADMAPVVASNGQKAVVAWRAVSASNLEGGNTLFDQRDSILYKVYTNGSWSEVKTLYNGTSGSVKGIVADMMADGTAAVAYTLDTDLNDSTTADREIAYAVIDKDSAEVTRSVQATKDSYLDENPQLTSVKFGSEERFVLGWYTEQAVASDSAMALDGGESGVSAETVSDIRLMEFGTDGTTSQLLPDSMDQIASGYDVNITSNFRFTKKSETINDLSILWVERAEEVTKNEDETSAMLVERDVLKGVKFYTHGMDHQQISFTAAVDVAEMDDGTLIDHFDAYVSNAATNEIKAVILGTTYDANNPVTRVAQTVGGDTVSFQVPYKESAMYTATETYMDKIEVPSFLPDYNTVRLNANTQIQFTVENKGIHAINKIDIQVGDQTTAHELETPLLPGDSIQLYADYSVGSKVTDPAYKVTATFDEDTGATGSAETGGSEGFVLGLGARDGLNVVSGTVYLDLPDVEIVQAKVMSEENGQRTIQIGLSNHSDAALANSGRSVRLSFFTDATCQTPVGELLPSIVISESKELAELDEGGYSKQITFDVGEFVKSKDGAVQEIPSGGVIIYIKAEVLDKGRDSQGEAVVQGEPTAQDNFASVTCDNLKERTGKDVIIKSDISMENGTATVTVDLQNTRLTETTTGNLLVTMLDASGNMVGYQQSYDPNANDKGLIPLSGEGKAEAQTFTFDNMDQYPNATFQVQYSDLVIEEIGEVNTELGSLFCQGLLADINSVKWTETSAGHYEATVINHGMSSTQVTAMAKSPDAKVSFSGASSKDNAAFGTVSLDSNGTGTITITVTNGGKNSTYVLNIVTDSTPDPGPGPGPGPDPVPVTSVSLNKTSMELKVGGSERLTATVAPTNATNKDVTWTSSDSSVATVDSNGNVTAHKVGTAIITVTTKDGNRIATCEVTVKAGSTQTVSVTGVTLNKSSMNLTVGGTDRLTATIAPSNATNKGLIWTSSNPAVATVDSSGNVTAVGAGTAVITVTTVDGSFTATCTVTVKTASTDPGKPTDPNRPGTGGGGYTVTVTKPEHGKVTASPTNANSGSTVTLTVTPDSGYVLNTLTVTDSRGNEIKLTAQSGGKYTFTMPSRAVTVKATFVPLPGNVTKPCDGGADCPSRAFTDLGGVGTWYHEAVDYALRNNLMGGYGNGLFGPNNNLTRAQLAQILYNREGRPAVSGSNPFTDVANGAWYSDAITWAAANGIVSGYGGGKFGPNDNITREQLATILWRYSKSPAATNKELHFNDADEISGYALDAIRWAVEHGILNGFGDGRLGPKGLATRAQVAQMLKNFIENQEDNI